jgi:hypothetical protein
MTPRNVTPNSRRIRRNHESSRSQSH